MSKGTFKECLEALGARESSFLKGDPKQYTEENDHGFFGKYQFGEALLIDLKYYSADDYYTKLGSTRTKNEWKVDGKKNKWLGKYQVWSLEDFKKKPEVQEIAIREAFKLSYERANAMLYSKFMWFLEYELGSKKLAEEAIENLKRSEEKVDKTLFLRLKKLLEDYFRGEKKLVRRAIKNPKCKIGLKDYVGVTIQGIEMSMTGMLAGAHLRGPSNLVKFLHNKRDEKGDEIGTKISEYITKFGGYDFNYDSDLSDVQVPTKIKQDSVSTKIKEDSPGWFARLWGYMRSLEEEIPGWNCPIDGDDPPESVY